MKTYTTESQIRLVGKVWEIRRYLKMALQRTDGHLLLSDYLNGQAGSKQAERPAVDPKVVLLQPRPVYDTAGHEADRTKKAPSLRTTTARVIPFPMR